MATQVAPPTFTTDIKPLFRESDRASMQKAFDLWEYEDVRSHQDAILDRLADGSMPCDGPWPASSLELFRAWVAAGSRP